MLKLAEIIKTKETLFGYVFIVAILLIKIIIYNSGYWMDFRAGNANRVEYAIPVILLGIFATVYFSIIIQDLSPVSMIMRTIGQNTIYIVFWHIFSFQIVSCFELKIMNLTMDTTWPNIYIGNILSVYFLVLFGICTPMIGGIVWKRCISAPKKHRFIDKK